MTWNPFLVACLSFTFGLCAYAVILANFSPKWDRHQRIQLPRALFYLLEIAIILSAGEVQWVLEAEGVAGLYVQTFFAPNSNLHTPFAVATMCLMSACWAGELVFFPGKIDKLYTIHHYGVLASVMASLLSSSGMLLGLVFHALCDVASLASLVSFLMRSRLWKKNTQSLILSAGVCFWYSFWRLICILTYAYGFSWVAVYWEGVVGVLDVPKVLISLLPASIVFYSVGSVTRLWKKLAKSQSLDSKAGSTLVETEREIDRGRQTERDRQRQTEKREPAEC